MRIVYGIYNRIATFELPPDASDRNGEAVSPQHQGVTHNRDLWRSGPKSQLLYIYRENGSGVINFDTLPPVFASDTVIRGFKSWSKAAKCASAAWTSSDPSDLSPSSKPLRAESCPLNPIHDSRRNASAWRTSDLFPQTRLRLGARTRT
jgi:hypothetical protein